MSIDKPERPEMDDDIARAYAQANALADDGRGPSAAVRANVLAAAREIAAESAARSAAGQVAPLAVTPVAPPVAEVGRRRAPAVNLSSWRVRSGAALCAVLLVGAISWRFDEAHRPGGGVQVAQAELRLAEPPTSTAPAALPVPALSGASFPYAAPPPVVADPVDNGAPAKAMAARPAARDGDLVVAQAEQAANRAPKSAGDATAPARRASPMAAAPVAADAAAPVVVASNASDQQGTPTEQAPTTVTVTASVAPQIYTRSATPPSVVPRRIAMIPKPAPIQATSAAPAAAPVATAAPAPASFGEADIAAADPQRVEVTSKLAFSSDVLKKVSPGLQGSLAGASARLLPPPLQAAADRGDVEALRRLLADPAVRVDAPDAAGRSALLHAVLAQHADAVRLLVAAGADPVRADTAGLTPRAAAQAGASAEIAALLAAPPR